jgi:hypothetical protein
MPDIFGILRLLKSALLTQQKAIGVNGNNIANANTTGTGSSVIALLITRFLLNSWNA